MEQKSAKMSIPVMQNFDQQ